MTTYETQVEYDLAESGIHPLTTAELLAFDPEPDKRAHELLNIPLNYSEARGTHELRARIAATYDGLTPDDILITTGAIEANYLLFNALLAPGDEVVSVFPAYQQLYTVPEAIGCTVQTVTLREEDGYRYDVDELRRLVTDRTRMIVINTPHNPTGAALSAAECRAVYEIADSVGAYMLADEAYRWITVDGVPLPPPMRDLGPRAISVGTLSKPFGIPGLRLGWMAATAEIAARCWSYRDYTSLSPSGLSDYLASLAFAHREAILARTHDISARESRHLSRLPRRASRPLLVGRAARRAARPAPLPPRPALGDGRQSPRRGGERDARARLRLRHGGSPAPRPRRATGSLRHRPRPRRAVLSSSPRRDSRLMCDAPPSRVGKGAGG